MLSLRRFLRLVRFAIGVGGGCLSFAPLPLVAHDSPEHVIAALSSRLEHDDRGPLLWYRRALAYRAVGRLDLASADLRTALARAPEHIPALVELSEIDLARGRIAPALARISHAIGLVHDERERAPLYIKRAQVHEAAGNLARALADCELAFRGRPATVDWYLVRSRIESGLGRHEARVAGLKDGFDESRSVVLEAEWIKAMIDAGHSEPALERIEPKLAAARWKGSWLIQRARARLGRGGEAAARADLGAAIAEITQRLQPEKPDLTLLLERGVAHALLGNRGASLADLEAAKRHARNAWSSRWQELERVIMRALDELSLRAAPSSS